jgi:hypothetical protein
MVDLRTLFIRSTSPDAQNDSMVEQKRDTPSVGHMRGSSAICCSCSFSSHANYSYSLAGLSSYLDRVWASLFCQGAGKHQKIMVLEGPGILYPVSRRCSAVPLLLGKIDSATHDKGLVVTGVLFVPAMIELYVFLWAVEFCKPSEENRRVGD